jgi:hypothetical protein
VTSLKAKRKTTEEESANCGRVEAGRWPLNVEAPNSNLHAPEKLQSPGSKGRTRAICLKVEVWSFSGGWSLELGIFSNHSTIKLRR